jgi:hypothetical protein
MAYYISKDKQIAYISQIVNDIQKITDYKSIIIFMENMKILNDKNFVFGKESTIIVNPTSQNLKIIRNLEKIDLYNHIIKQIYPNTEILLSNWKKAEYMTEDRKYIILMPFVDTEKLHGLNIFYKNNQKTNRKIDIITLKDNKEKIEAILTNKTNIIEMDNWLGWC